MSRALDWLHQAENDLEWARYSLGGEFYAQTCFVAQQAAEKALKSVCFQQGYDVIKSHSLLQIVRELKINGELEQRAKELDIYFIAGRYPDAFPSGAPFELLTEGQANGALAAAEAIIAHARGLVEPTGD